MDWLTFISSLIEHCAWPVVVIFITIRYRKSLITLIESLTSLKVGDFVDASFSREAAKIADVSEAELPQSADHNEQQLIVDKLLKLPPRLAILDAWKIVEDAIEMFMINKMIGSTTSTIPPYKLPAQRKISELRRSGLITAHQAEMLNSLRKLRNDVVHGPYGLEPSQIDAINYIKSALAFSNFFQVNVDFNNH